MNVVLDTNVLISALLTRSGAESAVLFAVANQSLVWCVSRPVLVEYEAVLRRPKFSGISEA
jgi:putative PIN family toxin of toxin-antitoxin system